jgi:hypothetical protein
VCLKTLEGHISSVLTALFVTRAFLVVGGYLYLILFFSYILIACVITSMLFILFAALASAWCFLDGYNAKDVCNMSTASSTSPSSCSSSQWPSWPHRTTVAYASIDSTCKPRASAGSQTSAGTSWSGIWWSRFVFSFHNINYYFVSHLKFYNFLNFKCVVVNLCVLYSSSVLYNIPYLVFFFFFKFQNMKL